MDGEDGRSREIEGGTKKEERERRERKEGVKGRR